MKRREGEKRGKRACTHRYASNVFSKPIHFPRTLFETRKPPCTPSLYFSLPLICSALLRFACRRFPFLPRLPTSSLPLEIVATKRFPVLLVFRAIIRPQPVSFVLWLALSGHVLPACSRKSPANRSRPDSFHCQRKKCERWLLYGG